MTAFTPFRKEDLEQSIPARFEAQTDRTPGRLAVKAGRREVVNLPAAAIPAEAAAREPSRRWRRNRPT